ncbi:hypothetical protein [Clostridium sp. B9]|uniref:hypothetical protein n=1 Tax=Clostridium sp. B9 TaxID=3423224 RepID=UPI003D2F01CC
MKNYFELLDINEKELPNVNLSNEQKERIRKFLKSTLRPYVANKKDTIPVDLSLENIIKVTNNLGEETDDVLFYVKGGKVLRDLVVEALDKECPIPEDELVYKTTLYTFDDYSYKVAPLAFSGTTTSHRIYVTKTKILFYNLDNYFRLIDVTTVPLKYIKTVFIADKSIRDFMEFSKNTLFIEFNRLGKNDLNIPSEYMLRGTRGHNDADLNAFLDVLKSLGIKNYRKLKFPIGKITFWIFNLAFLALFLWVLFSFLTGSNNFPKLSEYLFSLNM